MTKKKQTKAQQRKEIIWNIVNSLLAGALVFLGAFADGNISSTGIVLSMVAAAGIALTRFKDYWGTQENEYCKCLGKFI